MLLLLIVTVVEMVEIRPPINPTQKNKTTAFQQTLKKMDPPKQTRVGIFSNRPKKWPGFYFCVVMAQPDKNIPERQIAILDLACHTPEIDH